MQLPFSMSEPEIRFAAFASVLVVMGLLEILIPRRALLHANVPANVEAVRGLGPIVRFGDVMGRQSAALKYFLLANLYRHPNVTNMTQQAKRIVEELFALYMNAPQEMQPGFAARSAAGPGGDDPAHGIARVVADYIAGMTDRFAAREHERLTGLRLLA